MESNTSTDDDESMQLQNSEHSGTETDDNLIYRLTSILEEEADDLGFQKVEALIEKQAEEDSIDEKNGFWRKLFMNLCREGRVNVAGLFVSNYNIVDIIDGSDKDSGMTALMMSCERGHEQVVELLIARGADIDVRDACHKKTALMFACGNGHASIVSLLIGRGVFVDTRDERGRTALMYACESGWETVVDLLTRRSDGGGHAINIDISDYVDEMTPLMYACKGGNYGIVDLLLKSGGVLDINSYDKRSNTALMYACGCGADEVVDALMRNGADVDARDGRGNTALMHAIKNGHAKTVDLMIRKYNADVHANDLTRLKEILPSQSQSALDQQSLGKMVVHLILRYSDVIPPEEDEGLALNNIRYQQHVVRKLKTQGISTFDGSFVHMVREIELCVVRGRVHFEQLLKKHEESVPASITKPNTTILYCEMSHVKIARCIELLRSNNVQVRATYAGSKTALMHACESNDENMVRVLIDQHGVSVDGCGVEGKTPLMCCSENGNDVMTELLIEKGARVDASDWDKRTAVMQACKHGHKKMVDILLEHGADFTRQDPSGRTLLMLSCASRNGDLVNSLIERGADVHAVDFDLKETAFFYACANGHQNIAELLLEQGADINCQNCLKETALVKVCGQEQEKDTIFEFLLKHDGYKIDENKLKTMFSLACGKGHGRIAELLLKRGATFDSEDGSVQKGFLTFCEKGFSDAVESMIVAGIGGASTSKHLPLLLACEFGHQRIAEQVIKNGADVNANGGRALGFSCMKGHEAIADLLIKSGAKVNERGYEDKTPLMLACRNGHTNVVDLLIRHGADLNAEAEFGKSSLHLACENGHTAVVDLLIKNGAVLDTSLVDTQAATPLMYACIGGYKDLVLLLIKNGAEVVTGDEGKRQFPAFVSTCSNGHKTILEILIKHGLNIDGRDGNMETVQLFHAATEHGHAEIVKLLMKHNALVDADRFGHRPILRVCGNGHELTANILIKNGAKLDTETNFELIAACRSGHEVIINLLAKQGVDINKIGDETALMAACERQCSVTPVKQRKILQLLIKLGLDVNVVDDRGNTGLIHVIELDQFLLFDFLINSGADIDVRNKQGVTAVMKAASRDDTVYLKELLARNADLEVTDNRGRTVFAFALEGNGDGLRVLLDNRKLYSDDDEEKKCLNLKAVHTNAVKYKLCRPRLEALTATLEFGVFEWEWCPLRLYREIAPVARNYGYTPVRVSCCHECSIS